MTGQMKSCPNCGQGKLAPRYDRCPNCGYLYSEIYIKSKEDANKEQISIFQEGIDEANWEATENNRMGYEDFEGRRTE